MLSDILLDSLYENYKNGLLEKRDFENALFKIIYRDFPKMPGLDRSDRDDFLSWLYPKISRAVDNYRDLGSTFRTYIKVSIRMAAKDFIRNKIRERNAEEAAMLSQVSEMPVCELEFPECNSPSGPPPKEEIPDDVKNVRQSLILILKCCRYVSDDFVERTEVKLGMCRGELGAMILTLRNSRRQREDNVQVLRELSAKYLYRRIYYENMLKTVRDRPAAAERMERKLRNCRRNLEKTREKISKLNLEPSNALIAELLGISKCTVDVTLHNMRKKKAEK